MNTDKHHQGESKKCREKAYLQHRGRSTSPKSTQDRDDQEYDEGDQSSSCFLRGAGAERKGKLKMDDLKINTVLLKRCSIIPKENTGRPVVLRLIKKEVKHTIKNVIVTAPQVLATYHTSPGWELIRYKIKGSTTVQMIDKDITYDDETIDMAEQK
jgi:hypothetical protein